jgi:hypothetical protein
LFKAADADALAGAAWSGVGALQCPVIDGSVGVDGQVVHEYFHVGKAAHEFLGGFGMAARPTDWGPSLMVSDPSGE